jgi:phospholipid/cholesterol/gamma-HCH transport system permease protein
MKKIFVGLGQYFLFIYDTLVSLLIPPFEKQIFVYEIYKIGVKSLPVCLMTSFAVGMVLALQTGMASMSVLNEPAYIGTVVTFSLIKELGPMLTAVVLVGRVGAAITAEIGTMRVTEQIDAMYTLGTDPMKYLVVPRVVSFSFVLPILTMISSIVGITGGGIISYLRFDIPSTIYIRDCLVRYTK